MKNSKESFSNILSNIFSYNNEKNNKYNFILGETYDEHIPPDKVSTEEQQRKENESAKKKIYTSLDVNLEYLKVEYNTLINSDISIREFTLTANNRQYNAFLIYIDGMVDSKSINDFVLKPLMLKNTANTTQVGNNIISTAVANNITVRKIKKFNLEDYIYSHLLPQNSLSKREEFDEVISDINSGNCALFVDTCSTVFSIEVKGFQARTVSTPTNEVVIRGSQEAFVEALRTNTSMIRRIVNNEYLVIESSDVGKISRTKVAICYLKNIANEELVAEVKYRINNLDVDSLLSSGELEQLIQDESSVIFPQILSTERSDKTASYILEGRVAIIVNGSPYALVAPGVLADFMASPEDKNLKFQYANLLKIVRFVAAFFAFLLPGLYVAISNYHQELIPTELLFAVAASRQTVPFPIIFEIFIMELSFELIREAGLRVPSPIGPTIGIVGALVLGDAAVSASIVSPILIIIVAITGICSFAIPDFSLSFTIRIYRFLYVILGYLFGFFGIAIGLFVQFSILSSLNSFGVPYLSPYMPVSNLKSTINYFLGPIWKRDTRTDALNPSRRKSQDKISMKWKFGNSKK